MAAVERHNQNQKAAAAGDECPCCRGTLIGLAKPKQGVMCFHVRYFKYCLLANFHTQQNKKLAEQQAVSAAASSRRRHHGPPAAAAAAHAALNCTLRSWERSSLKRTRSTSLLLPSRARAKGPRGLIAWPGL